LPDYDFRTLSPLDFEQLARDLLNADRGLAVQSYAAGGDQGIDLRQVTPGGEVIVAQCKHYADSSWSTFMGAVRKESRRGGTLRADRYLFITSHKLSPQQQDEVATTLAGGGLPIAHDDVWGREELNAALGRRPAIERRHVKLWLSSAAVLDRMLGQGTWHRGDATVIRARGTARVWLQTPEYDEAMRLLERSGCCIVYGPPGAGKTFLAEMALFAHVQDGWEPVHIAGDIAAAWDSLSLDETRQVFYYDDFLGAGEFGVQKNEPSGLLNFISYIDGRQTHKRLLLTTREQVLGEGALEDDIVRRLASIHRQRNGVRVGEYSRDVRAGILINHLYYAEGLSAADREALAVDSRVLSIVAHPAYNPRLIEYGIGEAPERTMDAILATITRALDHPADVWEVSFQKLRPPGPDVLLTLATLPHRPWPAAQVLDLAGRGAEVDAREWRAARRMLEPTWVRFTGDSVVLASPGCLQYLLDVLDEPVTARRQVARIRLLDQVMTLTRAAGRLPSDIGRPQRPGLAHALDHAGLPQRIRAAVQATPGARALRDAALLLAAYGEAADTEWLMDQIEAAALVPGPGSALFRLAEALAALPAADGPRQRAMAGELVTRALLAVGTPRDLDDYEALPDDLRPPAVQGLARQQARGVLAAELDRLLHAPADPGERQVAAGELEQRAAWYDIDLDVTPLLDAPGPE
jgi:hypothetical protein